MTGGLGNEAHSHAICTDPPPSQLSCKEAGVKLGMLRGISELQAVAPMLQQQRQQPGMPSGGSLTGLIQVVCETTELRDEIVN